MKPFEIVFFDIVNVCNGKCPYCHTGTTKPQKSNPINREVFSDTLEKLLQYKIIDSNSIISLYNWGEPFLHPDLYGIIDIINKLNLKYALSTNASRLLKTNKSFVKNLDHIYFSMPGFSQKSYDKIHGLNFEKIRQNIEFLVKELRSFDFMGDIFISYHVYQFNISEMKSCEKFANKLGIIFKPYYAILNNWWELNQLVNKTLPYEKLLKLSENLFLFDIKEKMQKTPQNYKCPQFNYLIIDEQANIMPCCQLPKYHSEFYCGNIIKDDINSIFKKRSNMSVCGDCIKSGLAYYINNSLTFPEFYQMEANKVSKIKILRKVISKFIPEPIKVLLKQVSNKIKL